SEGRYAQIAGGIDGRLAVLRGYDDESGVEQALGFEVRDPRADGGINVFHFAEKGWRGRADGVQIAARQAQRVLNKLLPDADGLEIHAEDGGYGRAPRAVVRETVDFVGDGV